MKRLLAFATIMACAATTAWAAISVGPTGITQYFDTAPASGEWYGGSIAGGSSTYTSVDALISGVSALNASAITVSPISTTTTYGTHGSGIYYNSAAQLVYTKPSGVAALLGMAVLQNDTGASVSQVTLGYNLVTPDTAGAGGETAPGLNVFVSTTGAAGTWAHVPALSGVTTAGSLSTTITVDWLAGGQLYVLFADANGAANTDQSLGIDNFTVTPLSSGNVAVLNKPAEGAAFAAGAPVAVKATATGTPSSFTVYVDTDPADSNPGTAVATSTTNTVTGTFSRTTGTYYVYAVAAYPDSTSAYSSTNTVVIAANQNPSINIDSPLASANLELGVNIPVRMTVSDTDAGLSNLVVRFNGVVVGTVTNAGETTSLTVNVTNRSAALGTLVISATAQDILGGTTTASVSVNIIANPAPTVDSDLAILDPATSNRITAITVPVGQAVTNFVSFADGGLAISYVYFYDNGQFVFSNSTRITTATIMTNHYGLILNDTTLGTHRITAVGYDLGLMTVTSSPVTITVTNDPAYVYLVTNAAAWKYYAGTNDPGATWTSAGFVDSTWTTGEAELGYGNGTGGTLDRIHPDRTILLMPDGTPATSAKNPAILYRKHFTIADRTAYTNLLVKVLRDDAAIVYINGTSVWSTGLSNGVTSVAFNAYSGINATDDGTIYQVSTNIDPSTLLVNGDNVIAVEVHQNNSGSSDSTFDLMLLAQTASTPEVKPTVTVGYANGNIVISWPDSFSGYTLKSVNSLAAPINWSDAGATPVQGNGKYTVTIPATGLMKFFELAK